MQVRADLPAAYVFEIVQLAARWGVSPERILDGVGLSSAALKDPKMRVSLERAGRVAMRAIELTGEPALAYYLGKQLRLSTHGFLGFAAMTSATIKEALDLAVRFVATRTSAIAFSTYVEGETASLVLEERAPLGELREFLISAVLMGIGEISMTVTNRDVEGHAELDFPRPYYFDRIEQSHVGRVEFSCPANRLVFPSSVLDLEVVTADPVALELARAECERELLAVSGGVLAEVRAQLLDGEDRVRTIEEVASILHASPRTLKRRLASQGTTFSAIAEDVRRQRAFLLLERRDLSIGEVAAKLGYSDVANFTRAFRRWTGKTPAAFRKR